MFEFTEGERAYLREMRALSTDQHARRSQSGISPCPFQLWPSALR